VRAEWREVASAGDEGKAANGKHLLIAILDCGTDGTGITQKQAAQLFTVFGRLDTHTRKLRALG
jgi:hypothetical protein